MGHGPGPWNNYPYPPGPGVPPGGAPGPGGRQSANQTPSNQGPKPAPIGPAGDKKGPSTPSQPQQQPQQHELSADVPKSFGQQAAVGAPSLPTDSKPTVEEVKATAASLNNAAPAGPASQQKNIPTGPKGNTTRPTQILPAVPLPAALTARPVQPTAAKPAGDIGSGPMSAAQLRDATQQARAAVAVAMANMVKLDGQVANQQQATAAAVDNLTKRVNEMNVNATASGSGPRAPLGHSASAVPRGGRARGPRPAKVEVPDSDFDFESSNAKFNKQEIVKEAIAGSPLHEEPAVESAAPEVVADVTGVAQQAYNKSKSFFDNISSEAKDRAENNGQKPGGREWRGEEQRRNIETFGQGSVDGGYRGYRGGRGRGRGGRGRGFRGGRGASNGFPHREAPAAAQ